MNELTMPDFSSNNGPIDLKAIWDSGVRVILLKATEGRTYPWADAVGLTRAWTRRGGVTGHYHFMHPGDTAEGYAEADYFVDHVKPILSVGSFVVVDHETKGEGNAEVGAFIDRVHARLPHVRGLQYAYSAFFSTSGIRRHRGWGLMVAAYGSAAPTAPPSGGWATFDAWQYTDSGSLPGVAGHVDLSHINRSLIEPTLHAGDQSWAVIELKTRLRKAGYHGFRMTDRYGLGTVRAVEAFKRHRVRIFGPHPSGRVAGDRVWRHLP